MKKLITIILITAMLLPAAALAADMDVVGCWAHYDMFSDNTPSMTMFYLSEDYTCYYVTQCFTPFYHNSGRYHIGKWEPQEDGTVRITYGNARATFRFSDEYGASININSGDIYINLSKFDMK